MAAPFPLTAEQIVRGVAFALARVLDATRHRDAPVSRADRLALELGAFMGVAMTTESVPVRNGLTGRPTVDSQVVLADLSRSSAPAFDRSHRSEIADKAEAGR